MDQRFESISSFHEAFARTFEHQSGATQPGREIVCTWIESPLGPLVTAATPDGICLLEFSAAQFLPRQIDSLQRRFNCPVVPGVSPLFETLRTELHGYFIGELRAFSVPLIAPGTLFEERVWTELQRIPCGETRSYEDLAKSIGADGAQRAVGRANGRNRIAILIPCHRVINKSGALGGYAGSLWRKESLLHLERTGQLITDPSLRARQRAMLFEVDEPTAERTSR